MISESLKSCKISQNSLDVMDRNPRNQEVGLLAPMGGEYIRIQRNLNPRYPRYLCYARLDLFAFDSVFKK